MAKITRANLAAPPVGDGGAVLRHVDVPLTTMMEIRLAGHAVRPLLKALRDCPLSTVGGQVRLEIDLADVRNHGTGTVHEFWLRRSEAEFLAVVLDDLLDGCLKGSLLAVAKDERSRARRALREALERIERALT